MASTHVGVCVAHCLSVQENAVSTRPVPLSSHQTVSWAQGQYPWVSTFRIVSTEPTTLWVLAQGQYLYGCPGAALQYRASTYVGVQGPHCQYRSSTYVGVHGNTVSTGPVPMWVSMATLSVQGQYLCGCPGAHCQCRASTHVGVHGNTVSV